MSPEKMRLEIALLCGWEYVTVFASSEEKKNAVLLAECPECFGTGYGGSECDHDPCGRCKTTGIVEPYLNPKVPNYPEDLNACAEFRKTLTIEEQYRYGEECRKLSGNTGSKGGHFVPNGFGMFAVADLTALQHCEAFLRVKGKWID